MLTKDQWLRAIDTRHSVRSYLAKPIEAAALSTLAARIKAYNEESGLRIQLITNEPRGFTGLLAHYGKFSGVKNYIALVAPRMDRREEVAGYYGEKLVLEAQHLGLNTCWVALTYSRRKCPIIVNPGEKLVCVISLGYGIGPGKERKSKTPAQVSNLTAESPDWFRAGVEAALKAPTAINQQSFYLTLQGREVTAKDKGGPCSKTDLGIIKCHFELAAGSGNFTWAEE